MTALCAGMDPEMWAPDSPDARLAMAICRRCEGCPDNDPKPHGVIRQGVAYSDWGAPLPPCRACGRPVTVLRGGMPAFCGLCAVPDVPIPGRLAVQASKFRWLLKLGADDCQVAAELGVTRRTVQNLHIRNDSRTTPTREREAA